MCVCVEMHLVWFACIAHETRCTITAGKMHESRFTRQMSIYAWKYLTNFVKPINITTSARAREAGLLLLMCWIQSICCVLHTHTHTRALSKSLTHVCTAHHTAVCICIILTVRCRPVLRHPPTPRDALGTTLVMVLLRECVGCCLPVSFRRDGFDCGDCLSNNNIRNFKNECARMK